MHWASEKYSALAKIEELVFIENEKQLVSVTAI